MSGYLYRLVARTLGQANVVRPRLHPRFLVAPGDDRIEAEIAALLRAPDAPALANEHAAHDNANAGVTLSSSNGAVDGSVALSLSKGAFVAPSSSDNRVTLSLSKGDEGIEPLAADGSFNSSSADGVVAPNSSDGRVTLSLSKGDTRHHVDLPPLAADSLVTPTGHDNYFPRSVSDGLGRVTLSSSKGDKEIDPIAPPVVVTSPLSGSDATLRQAQGDTAASNASHDDRDVPLAPARIASSSGNSPRNDREHGEDAMIVNVSIGRIEVRSAPEPPTRVLREARPAAQKPREQLDAYLRGRNASKR